jgi:hypothetical protein
MKEARDGVDGGALDLIGRAGGGDGGRGRCATGGGMQAGERPGLRAAAAAGALWRGWRARGGVEVFGWRLGRHGGRKGRGRLGPTSRGGGGRT